MGWNLTRIGNLAMIPGFYLMLWVMSKYIHDRWTGPDLDVPRSFLMISDSFYTNLFLITEN